MKKNKKCMQYIVVCLLVLILLVSAKNIRLIVSRHFKSISSVDAIEHMEKALKEKYPDKSFEWIAGDYMDNSGDYKDFCYTSSFLVDNEADHIINVTARDNEYENLWDDKFSIFIDEKGYEKKTVLVKRLCGDYAQFIREEAGMELRKYTTLENVSVGSPYEDGNYREELPDNINYGMEFSPQLELKWEFEILLQNHVENEERKTMKEVIDVLSAKGFKFERYHFTFVIDNERVVYIYDRDDDTFSKVVE